MSVLQVSAEWFDNGLGAAAEVKLTTWHQQAEDQTIINAIQACSDAGIVSAIFSGQGLAAIANPPGPTNVLDMAQLKFVTANRHKVYLMVPAAVAACYQADGETVDPTYGQIANLIARFIANGISAGGAAIVGYLEGKRVLVSPSPFGYP